MRKTVLLFVVAFLSSACTATVGSAPPRADRHVTWEYKQDNICVASHLPPLEHDAQLVSILEQRGRDGWELVSVNPSSSTTETCYMLIFKREAR